MRINFDRYIEERTQDYSPRPWLFEKIGTWINSPGHSRYCLITAEPGGGKTAVAAQACNASRGTIRDSLPIPAGSIVAHHFCSAQDAGWIDPLEFSHSISSQLTASVHGFDTALRESQPELQSVTAAPQVHAEHVASGGKVTGVALTVKLGSPQATFIREVRAPLVKLYENGLARDVIILVDALDEGRLTMPGETIFDLIASFRQSLPRVRFLVTSRPEVDILRTLEQQDPNLVHYALSSGEAREESRRDVRRYVAAALSKTAGIKENLAPDLSLTALGEQLSAKADGNFLWTRFALAMLAKAKQTITSAALESLPSGLRSLYFEFVERVARKDRHRWRSEHALVLGTLVAAQEEMTVDELARYSLLDDACVAGVIRDIGQLLDTPSDDESPRYSLYHRSLRDFLLDRAAAQEYHCDLQAQHRRIVGVWLAAMQTPAGSRFESSGAYGLRNIAAHLFALRSDREARRQLYALASREWMEVKRAKLGDDSSFANDVALVAEAATNADPPDLVEEIRATSILTAIRSRAASVPSAMLALLALLGELDRARSYLALPNTADSKMRATSEVAEALMEIDPAAAEDLLREAIDAAPSEAASNDARGLRAHALAKLGRFEELAPLLAVLDMRDIHQVVVLVSAAGRYDLAEPIATGTSDAEVRAAVTSMIVTAAVTRGDFDVAQRLASTLPDWQHEAALDDIARGLRSSDPAGAAAIALSIANEWRRATALSAMVVDAARESDEELTKLTAILSEPDASSIVRDAANATAAEGDFEIATRLATRAGADAITDVNAKLVAKLLKDGEIAPAKEIVNGAAGVHAQRLRQVFAESTAEHGGGDLIVSVIESLNGSDDDLRSVIEVVAQKRDEHLVMEVLSELGAVPSSIYPRVAEVLVERKMIAAAFAVAALAPDAFRTEVIRSIAGAAVSERNAKAAWRAYSEAPEALSFSTADIVGLLIANDSLSFAEVIVMGERVSVSSESRRALVEAMARTNLIHSAVSVATAGASYEIDDLLARVLVHAATTKFGGAVAAVREATTSFQEIAECAVRELAARGDLKAVHELAAAAPRENRVLMRAAVELFEDGDPLNAMTLISSMIGLEPRDDISLILARSEDDAAVQEALRRALAMHDEESFDPDTAASIAAIAMRVLPYDNAAATIASLWKDIRLHEFLEKVARKGDVAAALKVTRFLVTHDVQIRLAAEAAIEHLTRVHQWEAAVRLGQSLPEYEREGGLKRMLKAAGEAGRLAAAVAAARELVPTQTDDILRSFFYNREKVALRAQAVELIGGETWFERQQLVEELCELRDFDTAMKIAKPAGDRALGHIVAARAAAGLSSSGAWRFGVDISDEVIEIAVDQLLEEGLDEQAFDYARELRKSLSKGRVAEALARSGKLARAIELAQTEAGWYQWHMLTQIAAVVVLSDRDRAMRIVDQIGDPSKRVDTVAAVIEALAKAGDVDGALTILRASKLLPTSVTALTRVAKALFDAGQRDEARSAIEVALRLVDSVEDTWARNLAVADLARAMAVRGTFDDALKLAELVPHADRWHSSVLVSIAAAQARKGAREAASATAWRGLAAARQSIDRDAIMYEAEFLALLASFGRAAVLRRLATEVVAARRATPSLGAFVLVNLTWKILSPWWLPRRKVDPLRKLRTWWRRWLGRRNALWLLAVAREAAAADTHEVMRTQALAAIAARYADLKRPADALKVAQIAEQTIRTWPPSAAHMNILASLGLAYCHDTGKLDSPERFVRETIQMIVQLNEPVYEVAPSISRLIAALGAPQEQIDALLSDARLAPDEFVAGHFVQLATDAAGHDVAHAIRIGNTLAGAAQEALPHMVRPLCTGLVACGEIARDASLFREAWTLARRLDPRDAADVFPDFARRVARVGDVSAREWIDAALRAIAADGDPPLTAARRAVIAGTLHIIGDLDEARRQMALALRESRNATRDAFFHVLHELIAVSGSDVRLSALARAIDETERWWPHRVAPR